MESWQKKYIFDNFTKVVENTICTTQLLTELIARSVLSLEDVDDIKTTRKQYDQSKRLYDITVTRENGYSALLKALCNCKQTGAAKLLFNGALNHVVESPIIDFQGKIGKLTDIFPGLDNLNILDILKSTDFSLDLKCIDYIVDHSQIFELCQQLIPAPTKFYIPRYISNRFQLNPELFNENCIDVFVFKEIDKTTLSELVQPNLVAYSNRQLVEFTSRFILLENDFHWLEMRNIPGRTVHLIHYEASDESFILEESVGNSEILMKFSKSHDQRAYISEDELLAKVEKENSGNGICICDTPGMGKSYVLASLARKVYSKKPEKLVAFIVLSDISKLLNCEGSHLTYLDPVNLLFDVIATCSFSKSILLKAVEKDCISIEVFLDGLDEVHPDLLEDTSNFLKALVSKKSNLNIYVTSRPHVRRELESSLGVIAYNLLPFNQQDQANFLVESWKQKLQIYEETKLEEFAKVCLQNLERETSKDERDIMGIPLLCFLLAEVHANEARLYSDSKYHFETPLVKSTSIYDMYKRFIDEKFESSEISTTPSCSSKTPKLSTECEIFGTDNMKRYHLGRALTLLFPDFSKQFNFPSPENGEQPTSLHFSLGILEQVLNHDSTESRFVHRTFGEFLVAEFFGDILIGEYQLSSISADVSKFCLQHVLKPVSSNQFKHSVIVSFIDKHIATITKYQVHPSLTNAFQEVILPPFLKNMLQACAKSNHLHLFRFLKTTLLTLSEDRLKLYRPFVVCKDEYIDKNVSGQVTSGKDEPSSDLLHLAAEHTVQLVDECFQLLRGCFGYTNELAAVLDNPPNTHIPFDTAARYANYEVIEYLADRFPLKSRNLLEHCMDRSYGGSENKTSRRIKILDLLLSKNKTLIHELPFQKNKNLNFDPRVHLTIIKHLINESKNLLENEEWLEWVSKIVESVFMRMSLDDFVELITSHDSSSPIFETAGRLLQNVTDRREKTMLLYAVQINTPLQTVKQLVELGAKPNHKNCYGKGVLHFSAKNGNKEMVEYFLSLDVSLEEYDDNGNTPLLLACRHLEMIKYLIENGADPSATNIWLETIAHRAARLLESADEFHELVVFLLEKPNSEILTKVSTLDKTFFKSEFQNLATSGTPLQTRLVIRDIGVKTLETLLDKNPGAINGVNEAGYGLLHAAVEGGQPVAIMKELVERRVDYNLKTEESENVLDIAIRRRDTEAIAYFKSLGMRPSEA